MVVKESDFMYIGDSAAPAPAPAPTPVPQDAPPAGDPGMAPETTPTWTDDLEALAAEAGAWDTPPENVPWETTPPEEVTPVWDTPPETTPWEWASPVDDAELQRMLDSLDSSSDKDAETTAGIKETIEDIKSTLPEWDTEISKKLDEALQKIAELEVSDAQSKKVIDVLKWEYEKILSDKISLEYGTASDTKIATIVNEDPDVKALIAAKLATGDNAKEKLAEARKAWWQNISWVTVDQIVGERKNAEVTALWDEEDAWSDIGQQEPSIYV